MNLLEKTKHLIRKILDQYAMINYGIIIWPDKKMCTWISLFDQIKKTIGDYFYLLGHHNS
uniref:Uncharacterized protein n=1 Tax=Onchocerca volvulus TaxID=6282 RepID=A0A8R1Y3I6_ONCVO